jgi:NAD(P)-dependent dehydrogenase (short-subunit alcohol dehydrogenase family)
MATFDGLTALVTGGASGIGLAAARLLAAQGAAVGVLDRGEQGPAGFAYARGDVSEDASVRAGVQQLVDVLGGLDILVNNAGIGAQGGIEDNDDNEWHRVFDVNVLGLTRPARPRCCR